MDQSFETVEGKLIYASADGENAPAATEKPPAPDDFEAWLSAHEFDGPDKLSALQLRALMYGFNATKANRASAAKASGLTAEEISNLFYIHNDNVMVTMLASGQLNDLASEDRERIPSENLPQLLERLEAAFVMMDIRDGEKPLLNTSAGILELRYRRTREQVRAEALLELRAKQGPFKFS